MRSFNTCRLPVTKFCELYPVFYFRQSFLISDAKLVEMMEVVCRCLDDEIVEVREMAAT